MRNSHLHGLVKEALLKYPFYPKHSLFPKLEKGKFYNSWGNTNDHGPTKKPYRKRTKFQTPQYLTPK